MNSNQNVRMNPRPEAWDTLPRTLVEVLLAADPDTPIIYIDQQGRETRSSYGALVVSARQVASGCRARGMLPGTRVLLQLLGNDEILPAFWGALLAGLVPTIVPVPVSYDMQSRQLEQLEHLYELLDLPALITNREYADAIARSPLLTLLHDASMLELSELAQTADDGQVHVAAPDDIAFFVLSSGSTGLPKAVTLTHNNMIARGRGANALCRNASSDVILSWLPFDHIGNISAYHISPILSSSTLVYAPKEYVLARPLRWLGLIDRYKVTHGWAPNFAFGLIVKALQNDDRSWDLSSVKGLLSAGELVSYHTVQAFLKATAPYGLKPEAVISAFGMAEVCSGVNYHLPEPGHGIRFLHLDRRELDSKAILMSPEDPNCISFASLGPVVPGMAMRIVSDKEEILEDGQIGYFQLRGEALMQGYYQNPEANQAFTADGWFDTGDAAFIWEDEIYLVGRAGLGIVINGANLSNLEVETAVEEVEGVEPSFTAACTVFPPYSDQLKLAIFFHPKSGLSTQEVQALPRLIQAQLTQRLGVRADYCIAVDRAEIPKTAIGKIQHKQLIKRFQAGEFSDAIADMRGAQSSVPANTGATELEIRVAEIWADVLQVSPVGLDDNFFELGGDSLALTQALERINDVCGASLTLVDLFKYTSVSALAGAMAGANDRSAMIAATQRAARRRRVDADGSRDVAVIGLACRFPGADDPDTFWQNLVDGVESITTFDDQAMARSGFSKGVYDRPQYVKASPILNDARRFDAEFFGYSRHDAELMDPQQRQFLECSWEAFENAGYDPTSYAGSVGVYAGAAMNTYLLNNVLPNRQALDPNDDLAVATLDSMGGFMAMVGNDKDYITTRVSYKLNLSGPSVNVQTACSTGLVCIHMACQSLLSGEADMFLAGCSSIQSPEHAGHLYQPGMIVTADGHVRSFDAKASGTIFGSGVGAVLLKRLDRAIEDRDHIHAVIKGSAVNNDAGAKVGYMAPSSDGQAQAVAEALSVAGIPTETIGLVEAHGTGTVVGDPIEFDGLVQAFREGTALAGFCALGSVKTNVGHLQISSGTAGFIKTVQSIKHGIVPPVVNFETPNPALDLEASPFFINSEAVDWPLPGVRRAAVNSLGIGGTNAHVILEQAPEPTPRDSLQEHSQDRPRHLLMLTARSDDALRTLAERYREHLLAHPEQSLGDVCFTANVGRKHFDQRLLVHASDSREMAERLDQHPLLTDAEADSSLVSAKGGPMAMLFTGQGSQYAGIAQSLYGCDPVFTTYVDQCAQLFAAAMDIDLVALLTDSAVTESELRPTRIAQPVIFTVDYALARLWQAWGVVPDYLAGHSLGEYAAACVAGVFSLEDAVKLVAARAEAMQALPEVGEMWSVACDAKTARAGISEAGQAVALAADNAPESVVIAGHSDAIAPVLRLLQSMDIHCQPLATSHAFHSPLMAEACKSFAVIAAEVSYSSPTIPLVSNLTGCIASDEMLSADYWCQHMLRTVHFRQSMQELDTLGVRTFLEVGPLPTLTALAMQTLSGDHRWLSSLVKGQPAWSTLLDAALQLAQLDRLDLAAFDTAYPRRRLPLPTYPFAKTQFWMEPPKPQARSGGVDTGSLLGCRLPLPTVRDLVYENEFDPLKLPVLRDHLVAERIVVSAAGLLSMMLQLGRERQGAHNTLTLRDIMFERPMLVQESQTTRVQTVLNADSSRIQIISMTGESLDDSLTHVSAQLDVEATAPPARIDLTARKQDCSKRIGIGQYLAQISRRKFSLGPSYRWMSALHTGDAVALASLKVPGRLGGVDAALAPHPGMLDTCFGLLLQTAELPEDSTWLPFAIEAVRWLPGDTSRAAYALFTLRDASSDRLVIGDGQILDEQGEVLVEIVGLQARPFEAAQLAADRASDAEALFEHCWQQVDFPEDSGVSSHWLLVGEKTSARVLATALADDGHRVTLADSFEGAPDDVDGVISLLGLAVAEAPFDALYRNQALLKDIVNAEHALTRGVWVISENGDSASGSGTINPEQASLQGLCLSIRHEHPELSVTLLDLQSSDVESAILRALGKDEDIPVLAIDGDQLWRRRLSPVTTSDLTLQPRFRKDRSYLVTGAHGALGTAVVEWLVDSGVEHLLLAGRSALTLQRQVSLAALESRGVSIESVVCDLEDKAEVEKLFALPDKDGKPLAGVFHCAGALHDRPISESSKENLALVLAGKALGARNLHEASLRREALDYFALFSSAAAVLGNAGQTAYAAANAYLDGLARYRVAKGLAAVSINWGPWAGNGMADDSKAGRQLAALGFTPLEPRRALKSLASLIANGSPQICVVDCDWAEHTLGAPVNRCLLDEALLADAGRAAPAESDIKLADLDAAERLTLLQTLVPGALAATLGISSAVDIPRDQPMSEMGLDSLMSVQLRNHLGRHVEQTLPVGMAFTYPTLETLIGYLASLFDAPHVDAADNSSYESVQTSEDAAAVLDDLDALLDGLES
ncbi:MAG: SDR family NAD(P)-dependent oxidoreductase [Congregibacter sp.]